MEQNQEIKMKKCSKCEKELSATKEYFHGDSSRPDGLCYVCIECKSTSKKQRVLLTKNQRRCSCCKKILPLEKFRTNKKSKDGLMNICEECQKLKRNKTNNSFKICKICGLELPLDSDHYTVDRLCLDGFRNVCRECQGGKFYPRERQIWTKEENNILIMNYPYMSNKELVEKFLPLRSETKVSNQATKILNLHKDEEFMKFRYWSEEQLNLLINNYADMNTVELGVLINKNPANITAKAIELNIKKESWWSEDEISLLIDKYPYIKTRDLAKKYFPKRSYESVNIKAQKLNLKKNDDYLYEIRTKTGKFNLLRIPSQVGKNSPRWVERVVVKCDICGKDIILTPNNSQNQQNYFCSRACAGQWKSENWKGENSPVFGRGDEIWTEEMRRKQAVYAIKRLKEANHSSKITKPQAIVNQLLDDLNIINEKEHECKYYLVDNYLTDNNLMIEVQGNFYHCSPVLNLYNSRKVKILGKDKAKHSYIKKYRGIEVLYLWERDLERNTKLCEKLILEYIKNNGDLDNYHSFNYYLDENENLKLIEELYVIGY